MEDPRMNLFSALLVSILLFANCSSFATGGTMTGSGTAGSPYMVKDYADLKAIGSGSYALTAIYRLANDIDASASATENGGSGFVPIGNETTNFTGKFQGAGHAVKHLTILRPTFNRVGLIGYASQAVIDSLGVTNANVEGGYYVGAIAGYIEGIISYCHTTGNVAGVSCVGGVVGSNGVIDGYNNKINNCYSACNCYASGFILDGSTVGGIAGRSVFGIISNCHSTGNIKGNIVEVGGIAGQIEYSTISQCYSTGNITGGSYVGGIVGLNQEGIISICYATGNISSNSNGSGGIVGSNGAGYGGPGTTINCYATGNVTGTEDVGGVAGSNNDTISNCYAAGKVTGGYVGSVVGNNFESTVIQCFWNKQTTGLDSGYADEGSAFTGAGFTTAQMQKASNFTGWDFNTVWVIRSDSTYPGLQGIENAPFALPDFLKSNRNFVLSRVLLNDFDIEPGLKNLVVKIVRISEGTTDSIHTVAFPLNVPNGNADTVYYRIGKALATDTLWGNEAKAIITLDETFTSLAGYPEKSSSLIQNYPNPFTSTTTIKYKVTEPGFVSLKVFDSMGAEVASLVQEVKSVGEYSIEWNAAGLPSGVYFCRLQSGKFAEYKKLVLLK